MSGPVEPSADARQFAAGMLDMFVALQAVGFTEKQALAIIGHVIAAGLAQQ